MTRRLPPLKAIHAFEAAARHGSFVGAADELGVTAAAVSHQVKLLEDHLGAPLFRRLPRGLVLTESGLAVAKEAAKGFDHLAKAAGLMTTERVEGPLVISVLPSFATRWLARRLPAFRRRYPEIDPIIVSDSRLADLQAENVDVALRHGRGGYPGCQVDLILREQLFPVVSPQAAAGRVRAWSDLRDATLLHLADAGPRQPWSHWRPWLDAHGLADIPDPLRGPVFSHSNVMLDAAAAGMGVCIGRSHLVADDLASGRLIRPFAESQRSRFSYHLVCLSARRAEARITAFRDWILDVALQEHDDEA